MTNTASAVRRLPLVFAQSPLVSLAVFVWIVAGTSMPNQAHAGRLDGLLRRATRVADDMPVGSVDEMAERLAKSGAAREAVEAELRRSGKLSPSLDDAARAARRAAETETALRAAMSGFDPTTARAAESLDPAARETALMICRGGDQIATTIPDLAARSRFLQAAGPDAVAAAGMFGRPAADAAIRLDMALRAGEVVCLPGKRAATVADFGRLMTTYGSPGNAFWQRYVLPHWKAWLGSGALAWYLIDPDGFMDQAGGLTEEGFRRLTEVGGALAASAIRGTAQGGGAAVDHVARAASDSYLIGWRGVVPFIATIFILAIAFPRTRRSILRPLRWLCTTHAREPRQTNTNDQRSTPGDNRNAAAQANETR